MPDLTSRQRALLRSLAQTIRPVIQIGREGVNDALVQSVAEALNTRELIKVRALETAPGTTRELGEQIVRVLPDVSLVQTIGHVIVLYRPHPEKPVIRLPPV